LEIADRWANGVKTNPKGRPLSSRTSTLDGDLVVTGRNIVIFYCFEMWFVVQFVVQIPNLVFRFSSFLFTFILKCFKFTEIYLYFYLQQAKNARTFHRIKTLVKWGDHSCYDML
jgi:hypothetical protein